MIFSTLPCLAANAPSASRYAWADNRPVNHSATLNRNFKMFLCYRFEILQKINLEFRTSIINDSNKSSINSCLNLEPSSTWTSKVAWYWSQVIHNDETHKAKASRHFLKRDGARTRSKICALLFQSFLSQEHKMVLELPDCSRDYLLFAWCRQFTFPFLLITKMKK